MLSHFIPKTKNRKKINQASKEDHPKKSIKIENNLDAFLTIKKEREKREITHMK